MPNKPSRKPDPSKPGAQINSSKIAWLSLAVSTLGLIPTGLLISGLPTWSAGNDQAESRSKYFEALIQPNPDMGGENKPSVVAGIGLSYAAPESDAWNYLVNLQNQWRIYESRNELEGNDEVDVKHSRDEATVCINGDNNQTCSTIDEIQYDDNNRISTFLLDDIPLNQRTLLPQSEPYDETNKRLLLKFTGGTIGDSINMSFTFEIRNQSGSEVQIKSTAYYRGLNKDNELSVIGPEVLDQGQRAQYYVIAENQPGGWLELKAVVDDEPMSTHWLPIG